MRIVDRKTFLEMPAGTLFAKFTPHCFDELAVKGETTGNDFVVQELIPWFEGCNDSSDYFQTIERMIAGEPSPPLDFDCTARDGLFDPEQLFAVFDNDDVDRLIARLQRARRSGSWVVDLATHYRKLWLDEIENATGKRAPRVGDADPLGEE